MHFEHVIIVGRRSMMMEYCVRIRAGGSCWMTLLDCYKREVCNGMVPHMLDYEQEVVGESISYDLLCRFNFIELTLFVYVW